MRLATLSAAALRALFPVATATLVACSVPVAGGLDDAEANRIFVALDRANVDAVKEQDSAGEGKWRVTVARDDLPRALSVMREEDLPRRDPARRDRRRGQGLAGPERGRGARPAGGGHRGVSSSDRSRGSTAFFRLACTSTCRPRARCGTRRPRAAAPECSSSTGARRRRSAPSRSSASSPAGSRGCCPRDVVVVMVARPAPAAVDGLDGDGLAHVGPIAVTRASMRQLQAALVVLVAAGRGPRSGDARALLPAVARARVARGRSAPQPGLALTRRARS